MQDDTRLGGRTQQHSAAHMGVDRSRAAVPGQVKASRALVLLTPPSPHRVRRGSAGPTPPCCRFASRSYLLLLTRRVLATSHQEAAQSIQLQQSLAADHLLRTVRIFASSHLLLASGLVLLAALTSRHSCSLTTLAHSMVE